ncbi:hypothetical protein QP608_12445, partial [Staphylococcus epidermidis]|nr:hypothetical protein [Staphylococcus epidermidis]
LIASGGKFAQKAAEAGLVVFDAAPGFDSEADYRRREAQRKESNIGTKMGNFSFFSEEMNEFVDLLPAQQRVHGENWYRGTADAVTQNLDIIRRYSAEYIV